MSKNVESRLKKLEAKEEQRECGNYDCAIIVMKDGESEAEALERTKQEEGTSKSATDRPRRRSIVIYVRGVAGRTLEDIWNQECRL